MQKATQKSTRLKTTKHNSSSSVRIGFAYSTSYLLPLRPSSLSPLSRRFSQQHHRPSVSHGVPVYLPADAAVSHYASRCFVWCLVAEVQACMLLQTEFNNNTINEPKPRPPSTAIFQYLMGPWDLAPLDSHCCETGNDAAACDAGVWWSVRIQLSFRVGRIEKRQLRKADQRLVVSNFVLCTARVLSPQSTPTRVCIK